MNIKRIIYLAVIFLCITLNFTGVSALSDIYIRTDHDSLEILEKDKFFPIYKISNMELFKSMPDILQWLDHKLIDANSSLHDEVQSTISSIISFDTDLDDWLQFYQQGDITGEEYDEYSGKAKQQIQKLECKLVQLLISDLDCYKCMIQ